MRGTRVEGRDVLGNVDGRGGVSCHSGEARLQQHPDGGGADPVDGARLGEEARREDRGVVREDDHARQAVPVDVPAGREDEREGGREGGWIGCGRMRRGREIQAIASVSRTLVCARWRSCHWMGLSSMFKSTRMFPIVHMEYNLVPFCVPDCLWNVRTIAFAEFHRDFPNMAPNAHVMHCQSIKTSLQCCFLPACSAHSPHSLLSHLLLQGRPLPPCSLHFLLHAQVYKP